MTSVPPFPFHFLRDFLYLHFSLSAFVLYRAFSCSFFGFFICLIHRPQMRSVLFPPPPSPGCAILNRARLVLPLGSSLEFSTTPQLTLFPVLTLAARSITGIRLFNSLIAYSSSYVHRLEQLMYLFLFMTLTAPSQKPAPFCEGSFFLFLTRNAQTDQGSF